MKKLTCVLMLLFSMGYQPAYSDDIDIYVNASAAGGQPYVMMMLDWRPSLFNVLCSYGTPDTDPDPEVSNGTGCGATMSAETHGNLTTRASGDSVVTYEGFVAVMETVLNNPLYDPIYMGLMISNNDTNTNPYKEGGGTILEGYKLLGSVNSPSTDTGREEIIATLKSVPTNPSNSTTHKLQPSETFYEWFRYINGGVVINGTDVEYNFGSTGSTPTPTYDSNIISGTDYISPFIDPDACTKLFSIVLAMNAANQDDSLDTEIGEDMSSGAAKKFKDMFEYMHDPNTDLLSGVNEVQPLQESWVISDGGSVGATRDWAAAGGNPLFDLTDPKELEEQLGGALDSVLSVSSTFVAASVPVNVFNRAQTLDNLYIALFEAQSTLRWPGNLKKLKLNDSDADGVFDSIVDANGNPGFETTGDDLGRISFDALTFWTDETELPIVEGLPDGVDGRTVDRGGAGQKINGFIESGANVIGETNATTNARQVYVEPASITNGSANAFDDFDGDATTAAALADELLSLGGATPTAQNLLDAEELIEWGRGLDIDDLDGDTNTSDPRPWIMADAIHSRPLAINYGTTGSYSLTNPNIRIFMGTNDGLFHIFENTSSGGSESGGEIFAFYPREVLGNITLHRDDVVASSQMRYGIDGPAVALVVDNDGDGNIETGDSDEVYVYFGMRRGGSSYYALDVTNPSATPTLKWKITQTSGGDFDELGLTFSRPIVGKVKFGSTSTDVLIFTGGYNGGWDSSYTSRVGKDAGDADDSVGNAVYIVNARTGALIWKAYWDGTSATGSDTNGSAATGFSYQHADMVDSIPSTVTPLENLSGNIHRLYVGDTGGAVWRVDLPEVDSATDVETKWFITKFAELGTDGATTDRRFFHEPDIVETFDTTGNYDGILLNTGDRADPTETSVTNYLFYLKDRLIISGASAVKSRTPMVLTDIPDQTLCVTGLELSCSISLVNGWKIELEGTGEKALSSPLTDGGRVFFTTFEPFVGTSNCGVKEGDGFVYLVNLSDGTSVLNDKRKYDIGPGIPPGAITLGDAIYLPGGGADFGDIDGDGIDDGRSKLPPSLGKNLWLMYWREPGIDEL